MPSTSETSSLPQSLGARRILLIDPRPPTRGWIARYLRSAGCPCNVVAVASAEDFAASARLSETADLAILNLGSGRVGDRRIGAEIERLRARLADTPLTLFAESAGIEDIQSALRLGVRGYISTSLEEPVALAALRLVLAGGIFVGAETTGPAPRGVSQDGGEPAG